MASLVLDKVSRPVRNETPALLTPSVLDVDYFAEVWLNGVLLGLSRGRRVPRSKLRLRTMPCATTRRTCLVVRVIKPAVEEPIDGFVLADHHRTGSSPTRTICRGTCTISADHRGVSS